MKGHPRPLDYERAFQKTNKPKLIDCYIADGGEDLEDTINLTLFGPIGSDTFSLVAQCSCGYKTGHDDLDSLCPRCNTRVSTLWVEGSTYPFKRWIKLPSGIKFFHTLLMYHLIRALPLPAIYLKYKRTGSNREHRMTIVDWLLDVTTPLPDFLSDIPGRGMLYLIKNFDQVIQYLITKMKPHHAEEFVPFYERYKSRWLLDKIPIIAPELQSINYNQDNTAYALVDAVTPMFREVYSGLCSLVLAERLGTKLSAYNKNRRLYKLYKRYLEYNHTLLETKIIGKKKLIRQGIIGNRWHYSARTVSTPIVDMHYYDEIRIPWVIMVVVYKSFILAHLLNRYGYNLMEALNLWSIAKVTMPSSLTDFHSEEVKQGVHLIKKIMEDILLEYRTHSKLKGGPCLINRNPSIRHLALQLVFVVGFVESKALHVSSMIFPRPNADADGDNMSLFFIREVGMVKELAGLHPSTALVSGKFAAISDFLMCHSTTTVPLNNLLQESLEIHGTA